MINKLKYFIIILSILYVILFMSFKVFDKIILEERRIKLENIYNNLPIKFKNISTLDKETTFLEMDNYQERQKFDNTFLKGLVWYISPYEYMEIPYLIYGKTASVVLRGDNYVMKGKSQYSLEMSYYSMALMKLNIDKVVALYSYYGLTNNKGKFIY